MSGYSGGVPALPYKSGKYYMPDGVLTTAAGVVGSTGTIYLSPGFIRSAAALAALTVRLTTAVASGNFQIGLYASDPNTLDPLGAPLFSSASQTTAATGTFDIATSAVIGRGVYWLGRNVDATGATAAFQSIGGTTPPPMLIGQLAGMTANTNLPGLAATAATGYIKTSAYGTWPTFTGSFATDGFTLSASAQCPVWGFKIA